MVAGDAHVDSRGSRLRTPCSTNAASASRGRASETRIGQHRRATIPLGELGRVDAVPDAVTGIVNRPLQARYGLSENARRAVPCRRWSGFLASCQPMPVLMTFWRRHLAICWAHPLGLGGQDSAPSTRSSNGMAEDDQGARPESGTQIAAQPPRVESAPGSRATPPHWVAPGGLVRGAKNWTDQDSPPSPSPRRRR